MQEQLTGDRAQWLSFLTDFVFEHDGTPDLAPEDRDIWHRTQRHRYPADADYITPWLDANAARLRVLADALLPNPVDRLHCCRSVNEREQRWRDPLGWPSWREVELPEFEQHRADLRSIVDVLIGMVEKGSAVPPLGVAPITPATSWNPTLKLEVLAALQEAGEDGTNWSDVAKKVGRDTEVGKGEVRRVGAKLIEEHLAAGRGRQPKKITRKGTAHLTEAAYPGLRT